MRRRWLPLILVPVLVVGIIAGALGWDYQRFLMHPIPGNEAEPYFLVPRGASLRQIAERLKADGYLVDPHLFVVLAYLSGQARELRAGEYSWPSGLRPPELLEVLTSGRVVQHAVTLVEGWTFRRTLAALAERDVFSGDLSGLTDSELMARLGRPGQAPEGRFFPDTYSFPRGTAKLEILRRALQRMEEVLAEEWAERDAGLPLKTPYEALILASIVEKETGRKTERAKVAGVFVRRLRRGMRLQTDPTVIYGLGEDYDGDLTSADLRADTPYNTYRRGGLPPTPIALPGRASITAAVHPEEGEALYFVARGDGGHHFSATLEEHNRAVRRYILGDE